MEKDEVEEKLKELITMSEKNKKYRGHIIDKVIVIEKILDFIIAAYLCRNIETFKVIHDKILKEFTLYRKVNSFKNLNLHQNDKFGDKFKKLPKNLDEARLIRNQVAHNLENQATSELKIGLSHNEINGLKKIVLNQEFIIWFDEFTKKMHSDLLEIIWEYDILVNSFSKYIFESE